MNIKGLARSRSNSVLCGEETKTPHLMRINLIIVGPLWQRKLDRFMSAEG
jgi:hypothetical protein